MALAFVGLSLSVSAQHTVPRFGITPNADNTGRVLTYVYKTPVIYTSTTTVSPNASVTIIKPGIFTTTATAVVKAGVKDSWVGDELTFLFSGNATASETITFSTNFLTTTTVTCTASKKTVITFVFDGVAWIEKSRALNQ